MPSLLERSLLFTQPRTATTAARRLASGGQPRISVANRCLASIVALATAEGAFNVELPLNELVVEWCTEHYPVAPGRDTPDATVESQIRTMAKATPCRLPAGVSIVSAKARKLRGLPARAAIVIADDDSAQTDLARTDARTVGTEHAHAFDADEDNG